MIQNKIKTTQEDSFVKNDKSGKNKLLKKQKKSKKNKIENNKNKKVKTAELRIAV